MKTMLHLTLAAFGLAIFTISSTAQVQFNYVTNNGRITITGGCPSSLGAVTIPDTINGLPVTSIGDYVFLDCTSLTNVTIPNSVTRIGDGAFYGCPSLTGVLIGNSVSNIGNHAFENCNNLSGVTIPNSVRSIGYGAFFGCTRLTSIAVDSANPNYSSLDGVLFNKSRTVLTQHPCAKAGSYFIPNGVATIAEYAFSDCTSLRSIVIPNSVRAIGEYAFLRCTDLTSVTIPNSVTIIGDGAFEGCANLKAIYVQGNEPILGGSLFHGAGDVNVYYLPGATGWQSIFGGRPTTLWANPLLSADRVRANDNGFAFTVSWAPNSTFVVEARPDLASGAWSPINTNTPSSGTWDFTDPNWTNYPARLYRVRSRLSGAEPVNTQRFVRFEAPNYWVHEDEGEVKIGVVLSGEGVEPVTLEYYTYDGEAEAGKDYTETKGQLSFSLGEKLKYITIPIVNDLLAETSESFGVILDRPQGATFGYYWDAGTVITIVDNDSNPGVQFESETYWVREDQGELNLKVFRNNDHEDGAFSVDFTTKDGTAVAGRDYSETKGTLNFTPGEKVKRLTIPITPDTLGEWDVDFTVVLSHPTSFAILGRRATARITISKSFLPSSLVSEAVAQVNEAELMAVTRKITGEEPILLDGTADFLRARDTGSTLLGQATQLALEEFQVLRLEARYQPWLSSKLEDWFFQTFGTSVLLDQPLSDHNVLGIQPGKSRSEEIVVVAAHFDSRSDDGPRAPGADDNGSGSAAVLMAARILSQYEFARTLHFVLFTGEEQGLWGSSQYAAEAQAGRSNIVAAIVPDMIGFNPTGSPKCIVGSRVNQTGVRINGPGVPFEFTYPNDRTVASVFTNVVASTGLGDQFSPVIDWPGANMFGGPRSDYGSFWGGDYPAIVVSEATHSPHLHSTNDTISTLAPEFFTTVVKAIVGTAAHLAHPIGRKPLGVIQVANSDWTPGSGVGGAVFYARHEAGGSEGGGDAQDVAWSKVPTNSNPKSFTIFSEPYGVPLQTDSRPLESETIFRTKLAVADQTGSGISSSNQLRFVFLTPPDPDRIYLARIHVDGRHLQGGVDFDCVTNLQLVLADGGFVQLPNLHRVADGTVYGTCDISVRFLNTQPANCRLRIASVRSAAIELLASAQLGAHIVDQVLVSTNLDLHTWQVVQSYTNYVSPDAAHFEAGWTEVVFKLDTSALPVSDAYFFQLKRTWLGR